jgi:hypothetical protein
MTVKELIEFLKTQPENIQVAYRCYSEQCLLETKEIQLEMLCPPRKDGWIQNARPDKTQQQYLVFPGN